MGARKPKLEYAIVCDDIREEVGNKLSFIGTYGPDPDITVPWIPYSFPKLCFAILVKNVKSGYSFSIKVVDPPGNQLGKIINGTVPETLRGRTMFLMFAIFAPLKVDLEGLHKLTVTFNEDDKSKQEVKFNIKLIEKSK